MKNPERRASGTTWMRAQARWVEREMRVIYLVLRDPRVPRYCKAIAAGAVGYAVSPITLIPDWIPVIGFLDNVLVLGLGIWLVERLAPGQVVLECRERAAGAVTTPSRTNRAARLIVAAVVTVKVALALLFSGAVVALLRHM